MVVTLQYSRANWVRYWFACVDLNPETNMRANTQSIAIAIDGQIWEGGWVLHPAQSATGRVAVRRVFEREKKDRAQVLCKRDLVLCVLVKGDPLTSMSESQRRNKASRLKTRLKENKCEMMVKLKSDNYLNRMCTGMAAWVTHSHFPDELAKSKSIAFLNGVQEMVPPYNFRSYVLPSDHLTTRLPYSTADTEA